MIVSIENKLSIYNDNSKKRFIRSNEIKWK